jgi:hypothetical protein
VSSSGESGSDAAVASCRRDRGAQIELLPLTRIETSALIENAVARGNIQADAREHSAYLHQLSKGVPRVLEEPLMELATRKYKIDSSFGRHLLNLDRRIREIGGRNPQKLTPASFNHS